MDTQAERIKQQIARLKALRQELGWSEERCAHALGVTYSTLSRWERGEALPRSQLVLRVIDRFIATHTERGKP